MARPVMTEDEILALLEQHPDGLSLTELVMKSNKRFPAGIVGRLIDRGKIVTVDHNVRGSNIALWGYRHRISGGEWLRRQRTLSGD